MTDFWINYFFPFLTLIGLTILYFTIKNLLPSYFTEKGKNLATKEDISEITELVESVRHSFTSETEKLKANLLLLTNVQVGLVAEERNAIIDFNEKYFKWLNILIDSSFGNADASNNDDLEKYLRTLGQAYSDLLNSETRFGLFVEDIELSRFANKLKIEVLKTLAPLAPKSVIEFKYNNINIDMMRRNTPIEQQSEQYRELLNVKQKIQEEFNANMISGYKEILPLNRQFQQMCRVYIYKLLKAQEENLQ